MAMHRVETQLDDRTLTRLDGWRAKLRPEPSRADAVRILLAERLAGERRKNRTTPQPPIKRLPEADMLSAQYTLERVSGFGPMKFREIHEAALNPQTAIEHPEQLPFRGRTGEKLRAALRGLSTADLAAGKARAEDQLNLAEEYSAKILVHGDPEYPKRVYHSNNPVPVLYVRGDPAVWKGAGSVAIVGSRETREPYASSARKFGLSAARKDMVVVSGFAAGADSIGHVAARDANGCTVCVMPCGLDKVFPPENRDLWRNLLDYDGATFVSEFGFGQRASSLHLRKRNKLIVAFAQGVLVAQSAADGGAMNAYRFGREQKKPVATFKSDGKNDTSGNTLIGEDSRTGGVAFDLAANESEYEMWLNGLSS